jgi:membrane protease YdiL (CAAX protease family)
MNGKPTWRRGMGLYGLSFLLIVLISLLFMGLKPTNSLIDIPWLSLAISLGGVLLPAIVACYWPKNRAPGLPPLGRLNPWVFGGIALGSLPLYMLFAFIQMRFVKWLGISVPTGLVAPLTANGPFSFLWIWFAIAVLPALSEEFLYRGLLQRSLIARLGSWRGLLLSACLFSLVHLEPAGALSRILMGLWFGSLLLLTNSLWADIAAHAFNNTWGVVLANWHGPILSHMPYVYGAGILAAGASLACFFKGGFIKLPAVPGPQSMLMGPELPPFIPVREISIPEEK